MGEGARDDNVKKNKKWFLFFPHQMIWILIYTFFCMEPMQEGDHTVVIF